MLPFRITTLSIILALCYSIPAFSSNSIPITQISFVDYSPQIGQIRITANIYYIPFADVWAECNGQLLDKNKYPELYSIIGTTYGGDGNPNFSLPKIDPIQSNLRYIICTKGIMPTKPKPPTPPGPPPPPPPPPLYPPNNPFVGQIKTFTGSFVPFSDNWAECNGQLLNITKYPVLYSLIKNKFGGDGQSTFAVPNIPPVITNERYIINIAGNNPKTR